MVYAGEQESVSGQIPRIFSLSEVAFILRDTFLQVFPSAFWVKAEIAKMNIHLQSGHCYLDLVEKQLNRTKAQFRAVIWANDFDHISEKFSSIAREDLKGGMSILCLARPTYHALYGLSLQIIDIEPSYTLGEMERIKQATIEKLKEESLFNLNRSLPFPVVPLKLAVISAATSKGYADFLNILGNHPRKYNIEIQLFPALLQGDQAVASILAQLRNIEAQFDRFDLVMIIRGGGDEIGMTCFDNYLLAREVCLHPLPVVTGIGHSTNLTVVEMIANRNRITPTDVAYDLLGMLDVTFGKLEETETLLDQMITGFLGVQRARVNLKAQQISSLLHGRIVQENIRLGQNKRWLLGQSLNLIRNEQKKLENNIVLLCRKPGQLIQGRIELITGMERQVMLLDPVNVLKRGFSLTYRSDGTLIRSASGIEPLDSMVTQFHDGIVQSSVDSVNFSEL